MKNPSSFPISSCLQIEEFRAPGATPRIMPFWFWNSAMSEELVSQQIAQMADAGVGGFFLHPRQGLTLPYLSSEWFARVKFAVETAKKNGLQVWLYDEYPYPSGIAGGLLTANHPEFRARTLEHFVVDVEEAKPVRHEFPLGRLVSALACPIQNDEVIWDEAIDIRAHFGVVLTRELFWRWPMPPIPYNEKRFMADEGRLVLSWTPPPGKWRVFVGIEGQQSGFKYYDCFFDPLCPGAVEEFIRLTHEGYAQAVGEHFGKTIPGIFTDETEPPGWSPQIEAELLRAANMDLSALLPALRYADHPRASEVRFAFRECALRLFGERWEKPIAQWCAAHDLIWGAEKPTYRPAQFAGVAQPSTDAGHRRIGLPPEKLGGHDLRANHRAAIGAAEQNGHEEVRCECFHSLGWGATLQDQKWSIDWLTVQGVNRFTPHAFYATSSGLAKHDAAPSFFAENPYWPHFRALGDYTARLSLAMSSGRERARIALLHPTESLWVGSAQSRLAREEYEWLMNELIAQHHMFHPVDALTFHAAKPLDGALEVGRARYEILLIPPLCALDENTRNAVRVALGAGLKVLMAAPLGEENGFEGAGEMTGWPGVVSIENRADWMTKLDLERPLSIREGNRETEQSREIWALWREAGAQQLLFVANTSQQNVTATIEIEAEVAGWENWSLETGDVTPLAAQIEGTRSRISLNLAAFGSALLVSAAQNLQGGNQATTIISPTPLPTQGKWQISLDRPNALRLNRWKIASDAQNWADPTLDDGTLREVEALPLRFRDQVTHQWVEAISRDGKNPVWYRRHLHCDFVPDDLQILIENGAILGDWALFINGEAVPSNEFTPHSYHGDDKTAALVSRFLRVGDNLLALRVENAPETGGLRTPLHLIGTFSLGGETRRTLQPMPLEAPFHQLIAAGLPHFSGAATYRRQFSRHELSENVALPARFGDIAELLVNGVSLGVRPWSPYTWALPTESAQTIEVEIVVTNTLLPFIEGQIWDDESQAPLSV